MVLYPNTLTKQTKNGITEICYNQNTNMQCLTLIKQILAAAKRIQNMLTNLCITEVLHRFEFNTNN